jgi:hypothetical protein
MDNQPLMTNEKKIASLIEAGITAFTSFGDIPGANEILFTYSLLENALKAKSIADLIALHHDFLELKQINSPIFPDELQILIELSQVLDYLVRSEKVEFSQRLPYYAQMVATLDNVFESTKTLKILPIYKDAIGAYIISRWKVILLDKIKQLQGLPVLTLHIEDVEQSQEKIEITIILKNEGTGVAENIYVGNGGEILLAPNKQHIETLMPGKQTRLVFSMPIDKVIAERRVSLNIEYDDLEGKGRSIPFADVIRWQGVQKTFIPLPANPYNFGLPVERKHFYGRLQLLQNIAKSLETPLGKSAILIQGERRIGKTSLLQQLRIKLKPPLVPAYVNIQAITGSGLASFLEVFTFSILEALNENGISAEEPSLTLLRASPNIFFEYKFLKPVYQLIGERRIVLLIDEFNALEAKVKAGQFDSTIYEYIRNLMMTSRLSFVIAGTPEIEEIVQSYWSVMFNTFKRIPIPLFSRDEAEELITQPVQGFFKYDYLALERIYKATSGHPYYIQLLCHSLIEHGLNTETSYFTAQHVGQQIMRLVTGEGDYFKHNWSDITRDSKILLIFLSQFAASGDPATITELKTIFQRRGLPIDLDNSLGELTTRGIIVVENGKLSFRIELVGLWINSTKSIDGIVD